LELSIKDVRSQGEGEFDQFGHFSDKKGKGLQMRKSALFCAKTACFSKFMVCPHGKGVGRVELVRTFCIQEGEGVNFSRFCADVFYGWSLSIISIQMQNLQISKQTIQTLEYKIRRYVALTRNMESQTRKEKHKE